jgi:hypothetical protein
MIALALVFQLVAFVCAIIVLIHAFKNGGALQGILCLCVPFYIIYYMFAKFEHEKKNLIIGGYFGGIIIALVIQFMVIGTSR